MSQVTYDLLAVWALLSVPATVILFLTVRMQAKEIERLRKQLVHFTETRQQLAPPEADDPTSEQQALELDGMQTDLLEDTHRFRALTGGDDLPTPGKTGAEPPRNVGYHPKGISVFEKLRSRR